MRLSLRTVLLVGLGIWIAATPASSDRSFAVESVIHLRKNTNGNQVHYAVRVDEACRPRAADPVYPYWRMLETSEVETEDLRFWERPGYGVVQPEDVHRGISEGHFDFRIRGVPERLIRVETFRSGGVCRARAYTEIRGGRAIFEYIEITVSGWANVHRVEIFGISSDGESVSEITFEDD